MRDEMDDSDGTRIGLVEKETAPTIDPRELNDLLDFAARGGLGQAVA